MALTIRVISPGSTVWDSEAEEVILPSTTGQLGVLTGHAPMLTALDTGVMRVRQDKNWVSIAINGGFAEVEENEVIVLVNGGERGDRIDADEARVALSEAEARAGAKSGDRQEQFQADQALKRARARYQAAKGTTA
ncbi:ATP synthase F1 subunit epsilon [Leptolyngbya sp. FACHB-261]|uniref:ATP synthase F1 subunit epsilon n=1 Tax=Leptolyngbya sp. FACHB-261 TaxID=2692806 RepID=UPI0016881408|nr:ATP synthase F1 subunit epsilon [Leptolyngbya sp. FACHB-261]MBD2100297.1 F0F1 ATP synthase subunit epsilon [Leptolyngbya sp. FACHB-261]